jgi:hypothetical protein
LSAAAEQDAGFICGTPRTISGILSDATLLRSAMVITTGVGVDREVSPEERTLASSLTGGQLVEVSVIVRSEWAMDFVFHWALSVGTRSFRQGFGEWNFLVVVWEHAGRCGKPGASAVNGTLEAMNIGPGCADNKDDGICKHIPQLILNASPVNIAHPRRINPTFKNPASESP